MLPPVYHLGLNVEYGHKYEYMRTLIFSTFASDIPYKEYQFHQTPPGIVVELNEPLFSVSDDA